MTSRIEIGGLFELQWLPQLQAMLLESQSCYWQESLECCRGNPVEDMEGLWRHLFRSQAQHQAAWFAFPDGWLDDYWHSQNIKRMAKIGMTARICISTESHPENAWSCRYLVRRTLPKVTTLCCSSDCESVETQDSELRRWLKAGTLEAEVRRRLRDACWFAPGLKLR